LVANLARSCGSGGGRDDGSRPHLVAVDGSATESVREAQRRPEPGPVGIAPSPAPSAISPPLHSAGC
jgi:hypothetical protein